jgi:opacity protein-like surface antigen
MLPVYGQNEFQRFTFNAGGGFTEPIHRGGESLDRGWNVDLGLGMNFNPYAGLMLKWNYNAMDVNQTTLGDIGFPAGNVTVWSATLNPVIHLAPRSPVDVYITGGAGLYQWKNQFTQPSVSTFTAFDPYFGVFYPVAVPVNQVITDYTMNKFGWNAGMGLAFGAPGLNKVRFYSEARFNRMMLGNDRTFDMIPVSFGVRF